MKNKSTTVSLIIFGISCVFWTGFAFAQSAGMGGPIEPSKNIVSQSKIKNKTIEELDLPYKPPEVEETPDSETQVPDETIQPSQEIEKKPEIKAFDWSTLPFIPSKSPVLGAAPDPEIN